MSVTPKPSLFKFNDMQKIFMARRAEKCICLNDKRRGEESDIKRTSGLLFWLQYGNMEFFCSVTFQGVRQDYLTIRL